MKTANCLFATGLVLWASAGCSTNGAPEPPERHVQSVAQAIAAPAAGARKLHIGGPCNRSDGYAGLPEPEKPADAGAIWAAAPTGLDFHQLPPGVGYCLLADGKWRAHGHYTMNCSADSDCPEGHCEGSICEGTCKADSDCTSGEVCDPSSQTEPGKRSCRLVARPELKVLAAAAPAAAVMTGDVMTAGVAGKAAGAKIGP